MSYSEPLWFGKRYEEASSEVVLREFDFTNKSNLLGVYGHTEPDEDDDTLRRIVSLGFITNDCPQRAMMKHELNYAVMRGEWREIKREAEAITADETIMRILMICLMGGAVLSLCYCCLKNRGSFCKKRSSEELAKNPDRVVEQDAVV